MCKWRTYFSFSGDKCGIERLISNLAELAFFIDNISARHIYLYTQVYKYITVHGGDSGIE